MTDGMSGLRKFTPAGTPTDLSQWTVAHGGFILDADTGEPKGPGPGELRETRAVPGRELEEEWGITLTAKGRRALYIDVTGRASPVDYDAEREKDIIAAYLPIGENVGGVLILKDGMWSGWTVDPLPASGLRRASERN